MTHVKRLDRSMRPISSFSFTLHGWNETCCFEVNLATIPSNFLPLVKSENDVVIGTTNYDHHGNNMMIEYVLPGWIGYIGKYSGIMFTLASPHQLLSLYIVAGNLKRGRTFDTTEPFSNGQSSRLTVSRLQSRGKKLSTSTNSHR